MLCEVCAAAGVKSLIAGGNGGEEAVLEGVGASGEVW